jgi:putative transposase
VRLNTADGTCQEWHSEVLPRYARMTRQVEALIAGAYLSGTNTRHVQRPLGALFKGAFSKDTVSRVWRKVQVDWETWCHRSLAEQDVVRLILDGTVVRVRLDRSGDINLAVGGSGYSTRWAESAAGGAQHGRRERGTLAQLAR